MILKGYRLQDFTLNYYFVQIHVQTVLRDVQSNSSPLNFEYSPCYLHFNFFFIYKFYHFPAP